MTTTTGYVQLPPRLAAPAPQLAQRHPASQSPRTRRVDRVTVALLAGVGGSVAFAGISALALAALSTLT